MKIQKPNINTQRYNVCAFARLYFGKPTGDAVEEDAAVAMPSACLVNVMTTAAHWPPPPQPPRVWSPPPSARRGPSPASTQHTSETFPGPRDATQA